MGDIVKLGVEFRRKSEISAADKWASPEPSDLMVWEICVYTRGHDLMECMGCPAIEPRGEGDIGFITRGCRALAAEACRTMLAVQRLEVIGIGPGIQPNIK